jgi:hypothetical protein
MIVVTIGGVDRTALIEDITITDSVNSRVDTADFTIEKTPLDSYTPALNAEVIVTRNSVRIFGGVITSIEDELVGVNTIRYRVSCIDYTFFLNRKLVVERYEGVTINAIIADLVTKYAPTFTTTAVMADIEVASIAFNRITMSDALKKLADLVNYQWYVDYNQDIHFFASDSEPAPFSISDGNYIRDSLKITKDISQLRNRVLVQGGEVPGTPSTVELAGNGVTAEFDTKYKFAERPTVLVDGWAQTVGLDNTDDDGSFDCMWSFNQKYLRFTAGNIPPLPTGPAVTNIEITGNPLLPILVNVPDPASIAEFGEYEFAITDTNIVSEDQAIERGLAELKAYASSIAEGTVETYRFGLRSGQIVRATDALRALDEEFVIQKVQYRYLSTDATYDGLWSVTLATLKTVGIISILQKLLLKEELTIDEQLSLVNFLRLEDAVAVDDTMGAVTTNTGPFVWAFLSNSDFSDQPPFTAATSTFQRWIDGTAGGSTTNNRYRWALTPSGTSTSSAQFDTVDDRDCVTIVATALDKVGATVDLVAVSNTVTYPGPTLTLPQLATAIPVVAGETYNFNMDYYLQSVSNAAQVSSVIRITWYDAAGNRVGNTSTGTINNSNLNAWTTVGGSAVAPAGAAYLVVGPSIQASGADGAGRAMTCSYTDVEVSQTGKTPMTWGFFTWA